MKIFENKRIRVKLTDEQAGKFDNDRAKILSHAMVILGNQSELNHLNQDTYTDDEYIEAGLNAFFYDQLVESHPDNVGEIIYRLENNHRIPQRWAISISGAQAHAAAHERDEIIERGKQAIEFDQKIEKNYRGRFSKSDWNIEIIGDMPEQIGMCRYKNFSFQGIEVIDATVKPHSTSAHVGLPRSWIGSRVSIVRLDNPQ